MSSVRSNPKADFKPSKPLFEPKGKNKLEGHEWYIYSMKTEGSSTITIQAPKKLKTNEDVFTFAETIIQLVFDPSKLDATQEKNEILFAKAVFEELSKQEYEYSKQYLGLAIEIDTFMDKFIKLKEKMQGSNSTLTDDQLNSKVRNELAKQGTLQPYPVEQDEVSDSKSSPNAKSQKPSQKETVHKRPRQAKMAGSNVRRGKDSAKPKPVDLYAIASNTDYLYDSTPTAKATAGHLNNHLLRTPKALSNEDSKKDTSLQNATKMTLTNNETTS